MDKTKINSLSIVIPCFNEPENVPLLIQHIKKIIETINFKLEVIIVDGCSSDNTPEILKNELNSLDPEVFKLILQQKKMGYGYDIIEGLKLAQNDVLSWTHADMQTDIADVIEGFKIFQSTYKSDPSLKFLVKGKRRGRPILDVLLTFGMQVSVLFLLKISLYDINAQPKIFSRYFFESFLKNDSPDDFSLDLYALSQAKRNSYKILSFPVSFKKRLLGVAKGGGGSMKNRINLIKRTFKYILNLSRQV